MGLTRHSRRLRNSVGYEIFATLQNSYSVLIFYVFAPISFCLLTCNSKFGLNSSCLSSLDDFGLI